MKSEKKFLNRYENSKKKSVEVGIGFGQGFTCAVATLIRMHGCTSEAVELFRVGGVKFEDFEQYGIDDYDIEILKEHEKELTYRQP